MKVNGLITKCMVKVNIGGLMEDIMKESIKMIKNMVKVSLNGQMEEYMKENGKMENKMVEDFIPIKKVLKEKVYGKMLKE